MVKKKIYIASDHAGFEAKKKVCEILKENNFDFEDLGPFNTESVDYPDYAKNVCCMVLKNGAEKEGAFGILICGSGTGMQIAANKIRGIRAAFSYDKYSAQMARKDNNANVLTLRGREFDESLYEQIVLTFLNEDFSEFERHKRRIDKLKSIEKNQCSDLKINS